jgi:homoserine/homoserine lactone efflux protein
MAWSLWWVYLLASVGLSLTPGPNSLLVLAHGALHGRRRTLWTITGGALGFALLIGLSMLGIGALLRASADALVLLKWGGGAYLVWLGIQLWRAPPLQLDMPEIDGQHGPVRRSVMFRQGLLAAISNPKALLFYGAFLPQFIEPGRSLWLQYVVMAGTFLHDRVRGRVRPRQPGAPRAPLAAARGAALQPGLRRAVRGDGSSAAADELRR